MPMATQTDALPEARVPLTRDRILRAAVDLADRVGFESVSMRKVGQELGVEAMSLYNHVANKEEILDGMIELILGEIEDDLGGFAVQTDGADWKAAMRHRILSAREVMLRHPWAPRLIESRTAMSPIMMRYADTLLGILREGGFSYDLAHHAMHVLGSRMLGFAQELFEPEDKDQADVDADRMLRQMASQVPYIAGMMMEIAHDQPDSTLGWCDDQTEFEFGLDLILDGLDRLRDQG